MSTLKTRPTSAMGYIYRMAVYVASGFGFQVLVYGPDAWTSMSMAGHVLGWPMFLVVIVVEWLLHVGLWLVPIVLALLAGWWGWDRLTAWRARSWRKKQAARRTAAQAAVSAAG